MIEQSARPKVVVGRDPMRDVLSSNDALVVLPLEIAEHDTHLIRTLRCSRTVGGCEQGSREALSIAIDHYEDRRFIDSEAGLPPFDELSDDHPFDLEDWVGGEAWLYLAPDARLQTAEACPSRTTR